MKHFFMLLLLLSCFTKSNAQNSAYSIYYNTDEKGAGRLVFNDSLSYFYNFHRKDKFKKDAVIGTSVMHHAVYNDLRKDSLYSGVAASKKIKNSKKVIYSFERKRYEWVLGDSILMLGHTCRKAYALTSLVDTLFAVYATDIPKPFGPLFYYGLPGVILEMHYPIRNHVYIATKIERLPITVTLPNVPTITEAEYDKYLKEYLP